MSYEKDPDEIGALWEREGEKGRYMTGDVNGVRVVCFQVKSAHTKAPNWRVMKSKPRADQGTSRAAFTERPPVTDEEPPF